MAAEADAEEQEEAEVDLEVEEEAAEVEAEEKDHPSTKYRTTKRTWPTATHTRTAPRRKALGPPPAHQLLGAANNPEHLEGQPRGTTGDNSPRHLMCPGESAYRQQAFLPAQIAIASFECESGEA